MRKIELGEVAEVFGGYAFKSKDFKEEYGVPVVKISNIQDGVVSEETFKQFLPVEYLDKYENYEIRKDDILVALSGATTGKTGVYKLSRKSLLNQRVGLVRAMDGLADQKYLSYYVSKITDDILNKAQGVAQPNISTKELSRFKIPLPSLSDQKAIVSKLDRAQRLIDIDRQMLAKYDELIQSVFLEMFGDPVTCSFDESNVLELAELVEFKGGGTPSKKNKKYWGGDIPWISPKDMKQTFVDDSQDKITLDAVEESSTKVIEKGAVLSVVRSGILKNSWPLAINTVDVTLNQDMKALICSDQINNYYLLYYLKNYSRKILGSVRGTTADNISTSVFKKIPIKLPDLNAQLAFKDFVEKIEKEKSATKLKKSEVLFSSLVQGVFGQAGGS